MRVITSWGSTTAPAAPAHRSKRALWSCGYRGRGQAVKGATIPLDPPHGQVRPALDAVPARSVHQPDNEAGGKGGNLNRPNIELAHHLVRTPPFPLTCAVGLVRPAGPAVAAGPRGPGQKPGFLSRSGRSHTNPAGLLPHPSTHGAKTGTDHRSPAEPAKPLPRKETPPTITNFHPHSCLKTLSACGLLGPGSVPASLTLQACADPSAAVAA